MNSIIRLSAAINKVHCANPLDCLDEIKQVLTKMPECDIAVFPKLSLCGTCGNFITNQTILEQCSEALDSLADCTSGMESYVIAGLVVEDWDKPVSVMAILYHGQLVAYIPASAEYSKNPDYAYSEQIVPPGTVFSCGDMRFSILTCELSAMSAEAAEIAKNGCDLIIIPAYEPVYAGKFDEINRLAEAVSGSLGCAIAVVNGGIGDTSSPFVYNGFVAIYECGTQLASAKAGYESFSCTVDFDLDLIKPLKLNKAFENPSHSMLPSGSKRGLLRQVDKSPFMPDKCKPEYLSELFGLQVRSLVARMENIGISRLVIGVSGGVDSTAALLVCAAAVDVLELPRENIIAISMPGFGTTDRTYFNALNLIEHLRATQRDIPIKQSVQQHFEDIGHSGKKDTTYENAQARERAQILLDVANQVGGLVVGTGDLSEAAMGFTTFAGDHIANYNVNASITKTVLRELLGHVSQENIVGGVDEIISDILETPVSPELLPADESGEIKQKTEDILAPYELLDFFLYYFVKYSFRPMKMYYYACIAFSGQYEHTFIKDKLKMFLQKFCAAQFKRACSPDGAALTDVNLSNATYYIPSDLDSASLLKELEYISD